MIKISKTNWRFWKYKLLL